LFELERGSVVTAPTFQDQERLINRFTNLQVINSPKREVAFHVIITCASRAVEEFNAAD
jgi:hypothetical protein